MVLMDIDPSVSQQPAEEWQYRHLLGESAWYLYLSGTLIIVGGVYRVRCGPFVGWRTLIRPYLPQSEWNRLYATAEEAMRAVDDARRCRRSRAEVW